MEQDRIYEIYVMSEPWHLDEKGFPVCGIRERVGFYYSKDIAIRAIEENWCDLQDAYAKAAEMRPCEPGIYGYIYTPTSEIKYYEWNYDEDRWEPKERPYFEGFEL